MVRRTCHLRSVLQSSYRFGACLMSGAVRRAKARIINIYHHPEDNHFREYVANNSNVHKCIENSNEDIFDKAVIEKNN
jgi:hypothetical protein